MYSDWIELGFVKIRIGLDSDLIRYGFRLDTDWIGLDSDRFSLDSDWIVFGFVRIRLGLDSDLIRYGFGLDTDWIGFG